MILTLPRYTAQIWEGKSKPWQSNFNEKLKATNLEKNASGIRNTY